MSDPRTPHRPNYQSLKDTVPPHTEEQAIQAEPQATKQAAPEPDKVEEPAPYADVDEFEARVLEGMRQRGGRGARPGENEDIVRRERREYERVEDKKLAALEKMQKLKPPEKPNEPSQPESLNETL